MARPASSAAATTSPSFTEPPGWTTAVTPASAKTKQPVGEGEEGVAGAGTALGPFAGLLHGDLRRDHA